MMCMDDLEKAEQIWENITYSKVMDMDDEAAHAIIKGDFGAVNAGELLKKFLKVLTDGGFDITPLRKLISDSVDERAIRESPRDLYVTTFSVDDRREEILDVKSAPDGEIADMLMASAYFLAFKKEKLGGKRYMDGGGFNNVPIDALTERGYQDIIVIRIYGLGYDTTKSVRIPEGTDIRFIAPRQDLGGILEFDRRRCRMNMRLGYFDAQRFLYGLAGRRYYIDAPEEEEYYLTKLEAEAERYKVSRFRIYTVETFRQAIIEKYTEMLMKKETEQDEEETT